MSTEMATDTAQLRHVLGHIPTSVCIVTTSSDGVPAGATVGSFTSVSLTPPLVAFFLTEESSTLQILSKSGCFTVNVLAEHQQELCSRFAQKEADRFASGGWSPGRRGAPILDDALAILDCDVENIDRAGDHYMVLGRVVDVPAPMAAGRPLVFWRGALRSLVPVEAVPGRAGAPD